MLVFIWSFPNLVLYIDVQKSETDKIESLRHSLDKQAINRLHVVLK